MPMYNNRGPYRLENLEGTMKFCKCDMTENPPYCSGMCSSVGQKPYTVTFHEPTDVKICGCGRSDDKPYCDGTCVGSSW